MTFNTKKHTPRLGLLIKGTLGMTCLFIYCLTSTLAGVDHLFPHHHQLMHRPLSAKQEQ